MGVRAYSSAESEQKTRLVAERDGPQDKGRLQHTCRAAVCSIVPGKLRAFSSASSFFSCSLFLFPPRWPIDRGAAAAVVEVELRLTSVSLFFFLFTFSLATTASEVLRHQHSLGVPMPPNEPWDGTLPRSLFYFLKEVLPLAAEPRKCSIIIMLSLLPRRGGGGGSNIQ